MTLAIVPPALVAAPVTGVMTLAAASNVKTIAVLIGKLEPMMVTAVPTGPEVGTIEFIAAGTGGAVTVKVAEAVVAPAVTTTAGVPAAVPAGIVIVAGETYRRRPSGYLQRWVLWQRRQE